MSTSDADAGAADKEERGGPRAWNDDSGAAGREAGKFDGLGGSLSLSVDVSAPTSPGGGIGAAGDKFAGLKGPPQSPQYGLLVSLDEEMEAIGFGRFHVRALCVLGLANAADAVELLCLSFILPVLPGETISDSAKATLSAAIFVGMLVGGIFFGVASDSLGRRSMLALSLAANAAFGLISAASGSSFGALLFCRVMGGFGVGGSIPGVFSLAAEILPTKDRGFWLSTVAWWWMVGSLFASGAAWLMIGYAGLPWQAYAAACAIPAATAAAGVLLLLPESPRFTLSKGDAKEAARALSWIAAVNRTETRLDKGYALMPLYPEGEAAEEEAEEGEEESAAAGAGGLDSDKGVALHAGGTSEGGSAAAAGPREGGVEERTGLLSSSGKLGAAASPSSPVVAGRSVGQGGSVSLRSGTPSKSRAAGRGGAAARRGLGAKRKGGCSSAASSALAPVRDFFAPSTARTSGLLMTIWFCLSFGWYGLILWIPTLFSESDIKLDPYQDSFLVAAANLPGNVFSAFLMDRLGRRALLAGSLFSACACAAAMPFARTEVSAVLVASLLNAVSTVTWNALDCLSTESFPTHLRTSAMGVLSASGRLGSIVGQFVFGALIHVSISAMLSSAAAMLGIGALAALMLKNDPAGRSLDD